MLICEIPTIIIDRSNSKPTPGWKETISWFPMHWYLGIGSATFRRFSSSREESYQRIMFENVLAIHIHNKRQGIAIFH